MQAQTPKTSTVEDLLGNPFDLEEAPSPASPHNDLVDAEMMAKRAVTTKKLIDRLPEHRQQQAYDLAKQIDIEDRKSVV